MASTALRTLALAGVLFMFGGFPAQATTPNVLLVMFDDMNDLGMPGSRPNTPNLDSFREGALFFSNNQCPATLCNPSRCAILSGVSPHRSGVYTNDDNPWESGGVFEHTETLPHCFKNNGYKTVVAGKIFHNDSYHPTAQLDAMFDDHTNIGGGYGPFPTTPAIPAEEIDSGIWLNYQIWDGPDSDFADVVNTDKIVSELQAAHGQPFFISLGLYRPHDPYTAPRRFFDANPLNEVVLPPVVADDLADLPAIAQEWALNSAANHQKVVDGGYWEELLRAYYASVSFADWNFGRALAALDASPYASNTIVVVCADNGFHNGEKEHWGKKTLWEKSANTLFMVRAPGITSTNTTCTEVVSLQDLYPTLIELCGLTPPVHEIDGRDLSGLLANPQSGGSSVPVLSCHESGNYTLRDDRYRYIQYADGSEELYDHDLDPNEWNNVEAEQAYQAAKSALATNLPAETIHGFANPLDVPSGNPNIFKEGNTYYLLDRNNRKRSTDLVHWEAMPDWVDLAGSGLSGMWASHMVKAGGTYYFYFSSETASSGGLHTISVASATNITDTFELLAAPMWWNGNGYIDPYVMEAGGEYYMYYTYQKINPASGGNAKVYVSKLKPNMQELDGSPTFCIQPSQAWENGWQEAVHVLQHNGYYYMSWSSDLYSGPNYKVGYATSASPLGPWTKAAENPILARAVLPEGEVLGSGAMAFVESPDGNELFGLYFTHSKTDTQGVRQLNLDRVTYEDNGAAPDRLVVAGPSLDLQPWPSGVAAPTVATGQDDFSAAALDDRWINIWNVNSDKYWLFGGFLKIIPKKGDLYVGSAEDASQNIFLQYAPQYQRHSIFTRLLLPTAAKPIFGYIHYWQDPRNYIQMKLFEDDLVKIEQMVDDQLKVYEVQPLATGIEHLEIIRRTETDRFQFRVKAAGGEWEQLPLEVPDEFYATKVLKCGLGAGVEGDSNPSESNVVLFDSFGVDREVPDEASSGIRISLRGDNLATDKNNVVAGVVNGGGTWMADAASSANYSGDDANYPCITAALDTALDGAAFQIRFDPGVFDNVSTSETFGVRALNKTTSTASEGMGVRYGSAGAGIGGTTNDGFEGVAFNIGTTNAGLLTNYVLQVTKVELANFEVESAIILNNKTGEYLAFDANNIGTIPVDVSSLGIEVPGGRALPDAGVNQTGDADFTLMFGEIPTNSGFRLAAIEVELVCTASVHAYDTWAASHLLIQGEAGDDDGDGLANLCEYAIGGNPTNSLENGYETGFFVGSGGGSNWLEYLYPRKTVDDSGIEYRLVQREGLVDGTWTNGIYVETGTADLGEGMEFVTNRFPVDSNTKFIRLEIERVE